MKTIITINDYLEFQPNAETKYTEDELTSAINLSYSLLDAECGGAITDRWDLTIDDPNYLNPSQKEHIKNAFRIQTQYVLMCGLDFSKGSDQMSLGAFSISSNRPNRNLISQQALKELQLAGIWYQTDFINARNFGGVNRRLWCDIGEPMYNDYPLPQSVSDNRYARQKTTNQLQFNKFFKYDDQGNISFVDISGGGSDLSNYYNKQQVDNLLELKQPKEDNSLSTTSKIIVGAINENKAHLDLIDVNIEDFYDELSTKQDKQDENLQTTSKTIVGAINELNGKTLPHLFRYVVSWNQVASFNSVNELEEETNNTGRLRGIITILSPTSLDFSGSTSQEIANKVLQNISSLWSSGKGGCVSPSLALGYTDAGNDITRYVDNWWAENGSVSVECVSQDDIRTFITLNSNSISYCEVKTSQLF